MNNEIKEILEYVLSLTYGNENAIKGINKVKDYITNLQEENEKLKIEKQEEYNRFNLMAKFRDKALERTFIYKSRCEKAIQREMELSYLCDTQPDEELLNILQGGE